MKRKVLLVGIAAMFAVVLAWFFLLSRPAGDDLNDARGELDQAQATLSQLDGDLARLRSIESDLPRLQSGIETLRSAVPDTADLADFILSANEAAVAAGLEVTSIAPDEPRIGDGSGLTEINVGLNTEGGYYRILDFLNRLAELHRVITVENISLTAIRNEENPAQDPSLHVRIQARIYVNPVAATQQTTAAASGDGSAPAESAPAEGGESQ